MSKLAIVTGGARGIGLSICRRLVMDGYRVVAFDAVTTTDETDRNAAHVVCDVSKFDACEKAVRETVATHGTVDILVNNAGVIRDAMLHKMSLEQWRDVMNVDLDSLFNMTRQIIGPMRECGFGRIVNVSSVNAQRGQIGQTNYCAAKAGVVGFTRALALESAGRGVTVNAIAPGFTDTAMVATVPAPILASILQAVPIGRLAAPDEIARCVSFLVSEEAGFISGSVLSANGGLHMGA